MKVGQIGSMSVDINVNKRIVTVSVNDCRFEFEAETETDAYDMQEEYVGFLQAFIEILGKALKNRAKEVSNE